MMGVEASKQGARLLSTSRKVRVKRAQEYNFAVSVLISVFNCVIITECEADDWIKKLRAEFSESLSHDQLFSLPQGLS